MICPPGDLELLHRCARAATTWLPSSSRPTGASFGKVPLLPQFLHDLRSLTARLGIVLIFDEVITGFRCSPGGAQGFYKVTPDLTTLAKIMAGGYPVGALVGRAEIMKVMDYRRDNGIAAARPYPIRELTMPRPSAPRRDYHPQNNLHFGRHRDGQSHRGEPARRAECDHHGGLGSNWCVYGNFSNFHIFTNPDNEPVGPEDIMAGKVPGKSSRSLSGGGDLPHLMRTGLVCGGVDIAIWPGACCLAATPFEDVDRTACAFEKLLKMLAEEGRLGVGQRCCFV